MKYKEWLKQWLELYVKMSVKARTYCNYRDLATRYVAPRLGDYDTNALSAEILQSFVTNLSLSGKKGNLALAPSTVGLVVTVLQLSLHVAVEVGIAKEQFADHLKRPKKTETRKMNCFTVTEQRKIEDAILLNPTSKNFGIVLSLYTGLRIGEILALRWVDIDFKNKLLSVNGTSRDWYKDGKFVKVLDTPKTRSSKRTIPLPQQISDYLLILKKRSESEFVIAHGENGISTRSYQSTFQALLTKLNIPHRGFHALRHTFATRALECGMDVRTLSELLGHKNPSVTLTRYAHSMLDHKVTMMNKMGTLLM